MKSFLTISACLIFSLCHAQEVNVDIPAPVTNIFNVQFGERGDSGYLLMYRYMFPSPNYILNHIVMLDSAGNPVMSANSTYEESSSAKIIGLSDGGFVYSSAQLISFTESTPWIVQRFDDSMSEIWNYTYVNSDDDGSFLTKHAIDDEFGNIYLLARNSDYKSIVLKLNPDGTVIWSIGMAQNPNGSLYGIPVFLKKLSNGNICAVGTSGAGENTSTDMSISVFTTEGEVLSTKAFGEESEAYEVIKGQVELENGDLMLIGYGPNTTPGGYGLIARVTPEGETVWIKKYSGDVSYLWSGRTLSDNRIEVYGNPSGSQLKMIIDENGEIESALVHSEGRFPKIIKKENEQDVMFVPNYFDLLQVVVINPEDEFEPCYLGEEANVEVEDYAFIEYELGHAVLDFYNEFSHENQLDQADPSFATDACSSLSVNDINKNESFHLIPNPASDRFKIDLNGIQPLPTQIQIFDSLGSLIKSEKYLDGKEFDVSMLKNGLYLVVINTTEGMQINEKLLIAR